MALEQYDDPKVAERVREQTRMEEENQNKRKGWTSVLRENNSGWTPATAQAAVGLELGSRGRELRREATKEQERLANRSEDQVNADDDRDMEDFLSTQKVKRVYSPTGESEQGEINREMNKVRTRQVLRYLASSGILGSGGY